MCPFFLLSAARARQQELSRTFRQGPTGMAVVSGKVTVLLERLSAITIPLLFKDLSDDEKAEATLSYTASFAEAWKRIFGQYRHEAEGASKQREGFWE